jgi:hypothetical protein
VKEAELSLLRRLGAHEEHILVVQNNLASTYHSVGRGEEAIRIERDVYSGHTRLYGEEHERTLVAANNYATSLVDLRRFEEAKAVMRKTIPVARRVLGDDYSLTLRMRKDLAKVLWHDTDATLDDLHEAVTTLEEIERTARRVFGGAHPLTSALARDLRIVRAVLAARDGSGLEPLREAVEAMTPGGA